MSEPSRKPYLIRAMYEWMADAGYTPFILVDAEQPGVDVPEQFVQEGRIVFNIGASATQGLLLGNERIEFSARFSGQPRRVVVPIAAVLAIYARETAEGMMFTPEDEQAAGPAPEAGPGEGGERKPRPRGGKPNLKVIK